MSQRPVGRAITPVASLVITKKLGSWSRADHETPVSVPGNGYTRHQPRSLWHSRRLGGSAEWILGRLAISITFFSSPVERGLISGIGEVNTVHSTE